MFVWFQMYILLKVFFTIINFYTRHFRFPHRGWKYMRFLLQTLHIDNEIYRKKIQKDIYLYVNAADHIQQQLFWYGYYEKEAITLWQMLIKKDQVVIDIGANIGYYAVMAACRATEGKVYAFEPLPQIYTQLTKNATLNHLVNLEAIPFAVSNQNGRLPFYISDTGNTGMSGLSPSENFSGQIATVTVVSLDDWATSKQLTKIDFIKMDIEGAEVDALSGMKYILENYQPVLFIEIRETLLKQYGQTPAGIYHLLYGYGYTAYEIIKKTVIKKTAAYAEGDAVIFTPGNYLFPAGITVL
jgi:FkbM family methyltransferase